MSLSIVDLKHFSQTECFRLPESNKNEFFSYKTDKKMNFLVKMNCFYTKIITE